MNNMAIIKFPSVPEPQTFSPKLSDTKSGCLHQQPNPAPLQALAPPLFPPTMLKKHLSNQPTMTAKQPLTPRSPL